MKHLLFRLTLVIMMSIPGIAYSDITCYQNGNEAPCAAGCSTCGQGCLDAMDCNAGSAVNTPCGCSGVRAGDPSQLFTKLMVKNGSSKVSVTKKRISKKTKITENKITQKK